MGDVATIQNDRDPILTDAEPGGVVWGLVMSVPAAPGAALHLETEVLHIGLDPVLGEGMLQPGGVLQAVDLYLDRSLGPLVHGVHGRGGEHARTTMAATTAAATMPAAKPARWTTRRPRRDRGECCWAEWAATLDRSSCKSCVSKCRAGWS